MTKMLIVEKSVIEDLVPVGRTRVYIAEVGAGLYPREMFVDELKRRATLFPEGIVKWEDVIDSLERNGFIRFQFEEIAVDKSFSHSVVADMWQKQPVEKMVTREIKTHVGILRWASSKVRGGDRYKRVIELLVYWTPDSTKVVDNDALKMDFFKHIIECTPKMVWWGFGIDTIMSPIDGWAYPYSSKPNSGKATFEVAETPSDYPDGFWEYSDYDIDEFNEGIQLIKEGHMSMDDLKLAARSGREATEGDVTRGKASRVGQIIGGGDSGIIDVNTCIEDLRKLRDVKPMEIVKKAV